MGFMFTDEKTVIDATGLFRDCFVYFLLREGRVVYVGQSKTAGSRISSHKKDKDFDSVKLIRVEESRMSGIELAFIRLLNPEYNASGKGSPELMDHEIAAEFGIGCIDGQAHELSAFVEGEYGIVLITSGDLAGQIGYYDDDDHEHHCRAFLDRYHLDSEYLEDEYWNVICEEQGCENLAIVYTGSWNEGYHIVSHDELMSVKETPQLSEIVRNRLWPSRTKEFATAIGESMGIFLDGVGNDSEKSVG